LCNIILAVPNDISRGQTILNVFASDEFDFGVNADVTYSITGGNGSAFFGVGVQNGSIYVTNAVTSQSSRLLTLRVTAEDGGSPSLKASTTVRLQITPENRYEPEVGFLPCVVVFSSEGLPK